MVKEPLIEAEKLAASKTRARRFVLQVPLRYRVTGEDRWHRGESENISTSGVLFSGEQFVKSSTLVEMCLRMPGLNSGGAAEVICRGVIVRALREREADGLPVFAAKILHFRLIRP